jgi:putative nucleotidyltransferase with HDIG domain
VFAHTLSVLHWLTLIEDAVGMDSQSVPVSTRNQRTAWAHSVYIAVRKAFEPYAEQIRALGQEEVDGGINGRTLLRLGALFHDVGKAQTQTIDEEGRIRFLGHEKTGASLAALVLRRLNLSNEAIARVKKIVAGHMRPLHLANSGGKLSRRTIYRYFRATAESGINIALLSLADHLATYDGTGPIKQWHTLLDVVAGLCHHYFERHDETVAPPALVDGRTLMNALALEPGPEVGRLLRLIQEAQAAGELETAVAAIEFARTCHK